MRIIGGEYRSRILAEFAGEDVRPTSDRAREALFNILARKIPRARVLDLFAGSGAVGIESLSRGAGEVVFNDAAKESVALLKKNLATLKIAEGERVKIYDRDFSVCLDGLSGQFDIVFLDPPYRLDCKSALEKIVLRKLLKVDGVIVYERDRAFVGEIAGLEKYDERKYGKAIFTFFQLRKEEV